MSPDTVQPVPSLTVSLALLQAAKRFVLSVCLVFSVSLLTSLPAEANPRYASIILEEASGRVLYSRNADKQLYPASLTKIMTLYLLFEALQNRQVSLETRMKVSQLAANRSPSKLHLKPGQTITVKNAILALVTKSANDVSTVIAEHVSGTERAFALKMTRKAQALGMNRTTFKNASGLPNRAQLSTARDMARLGMAIRRDFPQHFKYFKQTSFNWQGRKFRNHNKLLTQFSGTDGIKTGYTNASGFNLVATTQRNDVRLIGVVFGGKTGRSRDLHMMSLLNRQFKRVKPIPIKSTPLPTAPIPRPVNLMPKSAHENELQTASVEQDQRYAVVTGVSVSEASVVSSIWSIQVGSFTRRVSAHKAAINARRTAQGQLELRPAELSLVTRGGLPLWRVRFSDLNESHARSACAALLSAGAACIALPASITDSS